MKFRYPFILVGLSFFAIFLTQCSMMTEIRREEALRAPDFGVYQGLKRRIAVLDFQNLSQTGGDKIGGAIADMIVSQLAKSGRFVILERQQIERILEEQALGQTGAITEETAVKAGLLLGVQCFLMGTIEELKQESGSRKIEPEKEKWKLALQAAVGFVKLHFNLVSASTGEVLQSDAVTATEFRPGFGLKTEDFDFQDMFQFDQTLLGIVCRKAANQLALKIIQSVSQIPWRGKVVKVMPGGIVYFTPGRGDGVQIGDQFDIYERQESGLEESLEFGGKKGSIKVV
ncbi:MAG: CsgG/HfaB family protein, partial [candidate division KSB1 bacterium]|nr:CsgG/HfaB family protein [candidate division KSB1 bacterium]